MQQIIRSTALIALLAMTHCASAADSGFYLGAGSGQTYSNITGDINKSLIDEGFSVVSLSINDTNTGWKLFAGYTFNAYFAAELSYVDLGQAGADIVIGGLAPGLINTRMTMNGINLGLKITYPFADQFFMFAKLGTFVWNAEASASATLDTKLGTANQNDNGADLSYGIGLGYAFTTHFSIRGDWDRYRLGGNADIDAGLWSISMQYQF